MLKQLKIYFLILFTLYSLMIGVQMISLIHQSGFFTLIVKEEVKPIIVQKGNTEFEFYSKYSNLGTLSIPVHVSREGNVNFRIKDVRSTNWIITQSYTTNAIKYLQEYPFGFVPIINSKDKMYIFDISSDSTKNGQVFLQSNSITTEFTYPKKKTAIPLILFNKISYIVSSTPWWISALLIISSVVIEISFFVLRSKSLIRTERIMFKTYKLVSPLIFLLVLGNTIMREQILSTPIVVTLSIIWLFSLCAIKDLLKVLTLSSVVIFILSISSLAIGAIGTSERLTSYFWFTFLLTAFGYIALCIKEHIPQIYERCQYYLHCCLALINKIGLKKIIIISLLLIVFISGNYRTYYLGGDDSRIFYLYPQDFLTNYITHSGPNSAPSTLTSWIPPSTLLYFTIFTILAKKVVGNLNLQSILYTLNFLGGIYFFYLLTGYLFKKKDIYTTISQLLTSLMYTFSIFNYYTLYNSQLISQFLLSIFPLTVYLFLKGVNEKKFYFMVIIGFLTSIFCFITVDAPWLFAAIIGVLPLIIIKCIDRKVILLKYTCFLALFTLLLNFHWISSLTYYSVFNKNNGPLASSSIVSTNFREQNAAGVKSLAGDNTIFYPFMNLYHYSIQKNYSWPYLPIFANWYVKILPFNVVLFILILAPVFLKNKISNEKKMYSLLFLCFLVTCYFFTVNIGNWGVNLFIFLNNYIPGFVMFRNMYDKFGLGMAFTFALLMTISLRIVLQNTLHKKIVMIIVILVLLLNAKPFIFNEFNSLPIWTTSNSYPGISGLNPDFLNLMNYIKSSPSSSRYLWLPLEYGNVIQIQDQKLPNHFYNGVSPLLFLTGKNDYSGILSFETYGDELQSDILKHRNASAGLLYQRLNVNYVIVNNTISDDLKQSYLCGDGLCDAQDSQYKNIILGKKIRDFGQKYSVYEINNAFKNNKVYLTTDLSNFAYPQAIITFQQKSDQQYSIHISHLKEKAFLVLLDTYYQEWDMYSGNNLIATGQHFRPFNYANGWLIDPNVVKRLSKSTVTTNDDGSINADITLIFPKPVYEKIAMYISIVSGIFGVLYLIKIYLRKKI